MFSIGTNLKYFYSKLYDKSNSGVIVDIGADFTPLPTKDLRLALVFSNIGFLYHKKIPCPILGRISMDLVTGDITHLKEEPKKLTFIGTIQTINDLSDITNTISHEILINIGNRYTKKYLN